jgi:hypothetical protein
MDSRQITPDRLIKRHEWTTTKRTRFFQALDDKPTDSSVAEVARENGLEPPTVYAWIAQRNQNQDINALRKTRKQSARLQSHKLGRPRQILSPELDKLLDPKQNPIREFPYEAMIKHFNLRVTTARSLQMNLTKRRGAQLFIKERIKPVSKANKQERVAYAYRMKNLPVHGYWDCIEFSDEAHFNPLEVRKQRVLRKRGYRYKRENLQPRDEPNISRSKLYNLHFSGSCSYTGVGKLVFYHDKSEDPPPPPKPPGKPRKRQTETEEQFQQRLADWKAEFPHPVETKRTGNSMTQKYYAENVLPFLIQRVQEGRRDQRGSFGADIPGPAEPRLLEDNDGSHRKDSSNIASDLKFFNWVESIDHPSQSPDLNVQEPIWGILKQRAREDTSWNTMEELKEVLQDEWSKVAQADVRRRIDEMPYRLQLVIDAGGSMIKTSLF